MYAAKPPHRTVQKTEPQSVVQYLLPFKPKECLQLTPECKARNSHENGERDWEESEEGSAGNSE